MNKYNNFNVSDWLNDREFQLWVFEGHDDEAWRALIKKMPDQHVNIEEARALLKKIEGDDEKISIQEIKLRVAEILKYVTDVENETRHYWWKNRWFQVASILLLIIGLGGGGVYWRQLLREQELVAVFEDSGKTTVVNNIENKSNSEKTINLPDGSTVVLKKNAKITFPKEFASDKRIIHMVGEAFFEIRKNAEKPFYVYTKGMVAKVVGTSFSIQATDDEEEVKLLVKSGVVQVYKRHAVHSLTESSENTKVRKNQMITLNQHTGETQVQKTVNAPLLNLKLESETFSFERTPLVTVFDILEKNYGIVIEYNRDKIAQCSITANLGDEPIYKKMEMICAVMNGKFQAKGDTIRVFTYGCKAL
jgi:transmembrane sensor